MLGTPYSKLETQNLRRIYTSLYISYTITMFRVLEPTYKANQSSIISLPLCLHQLANFYLRILRKNDIGKKECPALSSTVYQWLYHTYSLLMHLPYSERI